MFKRTETIEDMELKVEKTWHERAEVCGALAAVDYLLGNKTEWSEYLYEEPPNMDGIGRMMGAPKVDFKTDVGSLDRYRKYLADRETELTEQLRDAEECLLRHMRLEHDWLKKWLKRQIDSCDDRATVAKDVLESVLEKVTSRNIQ